MLNVETVMKWQFPEIEHSLTTRDCLLYALSVGYGRDPLDADELAFVYEDNLRVVPSIASILAHPSLWLRNPATGIAYLKVVHGEQNIAFHRPIPHQGTVIGQARVLGITDKGEGRGATILMENRLSLKEDGAPLATITRTSFCRGDGGCGNAGDQLQAPVPVPERAPDLRIAHGTDPGQALLYRLNGDYNPLHASPVSARKSGFDRPILHGLCTYGVACRAILAACCDNDPSRLAYLGARFTKPVFPGETIETRIWKEAQTMRFESYVLEREERVLGSGTALLKEASFDFPATRSDGRRIGSRGHRARSSRHCVARAGAEHCPS